MFNLVTILVRNRINKSLVNVIKSIYSETLAYVKSNNGLTYSLFYPLGLKQGCFLSHKLFSFLFNNYPKLLILQEATVFKSYQELVAHFR